MSYCTYFDLIGGIIYINGCVEKLTVLYCYLTQGVKKMKIAEALAFCGDRGVYFLSQLDMKDDVRDAFITVLHCCNSLIKKVLSKEVHPHTLFMYVHHNARLPMTGVRGGVICWRGCDLLKGVCCCLYKAFCGWVQYLSHIQPCTARNWPNCRKNSWWS